MLNRHDTSISKQLLRVVVNELPECVRTCTYKHVNIQACESVSRGRVVKEEWTSKSILKTGHMHILKHSHITHSPVYKAVDAMPKNLVHLILHLLLRGVGEERTSGEVWGE